MTISAIQNLSEVVESKITQDKEATKSSMSSWWNVQWRNIMAEFAATFILIMLGCMTCMPVAAFQTPLTAPLGFGMIVMINIQVFGHTSGAHMNPAVTLACVIFGDMSIFVGVTYVITQCLGAVAGYGVLTTLTTIDVSEHAVCVSVGPPEQNSIQTLIIEFAITAVLVLLNCSVWDPVNKDKFEGIPIKFGFTILALSLVAAPFTGAGMNPARSLGPAVWTNIWTDHWVYWVGPLLGSAFATILYKCVFTSQEMRKLKSLSQIE